MKSSIFLTGASGFIGSRLLRALDPQRYAHIYCLSRQPSEITAGNGLSENIRIIPGGLFDTETYLPALQQCQTVAHLAAATGNASPNEHFRVNALGTHVLLEQCRQAGVRQFLYVSTIAVKFKDKTDYPYALSKEEGEQATITGGLRYTIVRPTIVAGKAGKAWFGLGKLARLPLLVTPGNGTTKVQPIYVDDLVLCLKDILDHESFEDRILEIGGPETVTVEELLRKIYTVVHRTEPGRALHIPLGMIMPLVRGLERALDGKSPVSVGQLASFKNDGTITPGDVYERHRAHMKTVDQMVILSAREE